MELLTHQEKASETPNKLSLLESRLKEFMDDPHLILNEIDEEVREEFNVEFLEWDIQGGYELSSDYALDKNNALRAARTSKHSEELKKGNFNDLKDLMEQRFIEKTEERLEDADIYDWGK